MASTTLIIIIAVIFSLLCSSIGAYFIMQNETPPAPEPTSAQKLQTPPAQKLQTPPAQKLQTPSAPTPPATTPPATTPPATTPPPPAPTPPAALKIFKRSGESDSGCCGGESGEPHELFCPEGSFVKEFYGGSGAVIDRIGFKCSNGSDLGTRGGGGGAPFSVMSDDGFNKIHVKSGSFVDNIKFFANDQEKGAYGGGGGSGPHDLNCPNGKIMGLKLRTGGLVDRIQVICGKEQ